MNTAITSGVGPVFRVVITVCTAAITTTGVILFMVSNCLTIMRYSGFSASIGSHHGHHSDSYSYRYIHRACHRDVSIHNCGTSEVRKIQI